MNRRRIVFGGVGAALIGLGARPVTAATKMPRLAVMMVNAGDDQEGKRRLDALVKSLEESGWASGSTIGVDVHWLEGDAERTKSVARQIVQSKPDIIVVNGTPGTAALLSLTKSIPIVFAGVTNPVGAGFVSNLAHPGGNVTGFGSFEAEISAKWVQLLKEFAPDLQRVGLLTVPDLEGFGELLTAAGSAAGGLGLQVETLNVRSAADIEPAISAFAATPHRGLVVFPNFVNLTARDTIIALAARYRLPAIYSFTAYLDSGGLIAYGIDTADLFRRAGDYVSRILAGEKPGDLPVQGPVKFLLGVNVAAARAMGRQTPPMLLGRADEIVE